MNKLFLRKNSVSITILLFLLLFIFFINLKPSFLFNKFGGLRNFGLGKNNSTILPIWLLVIIISIISYVFILFCLL